MLFKTSTSVTHSALENTETDAIYLLKWFLAKGVYQKSTCIYVHMHISLHLYICYCLLKCICIYALRASGKIGLAN